MASAFDKKQLKFLSFLIGIRIQEKRKTRNTTNTIY